MLLGCVCNAHTGTGGVRNKLDYFIIVHSYNDISLNKKDDEGLTEVHGANVSVTMFSFKTK